MNDTNARKTALVTGATSGLGFEAAAQLAEAGYGKIIISGRSHDGVEVARRDLVGRTGRDRVRNRCARPRQDIQC